MKKILFLIICILSCGIHFWGLNWGTVSREKLVQVFGSKEAIEKSVPEMIKLRDKFYQAQQKIYSTGDIKSAITETYGHNLRSKPYSFLSDEIKFDAVRNFFLGSLNSDEQHNLVAISNLNPFKLDFNPNIYVWGGLHFYNAAFILVIAKLSGIISLTPGIQYYFMHPEEVAGMYIVIRFISAISAVLAVLLIYFFARSIAGNFTGFVSSIIFMILPLIIWNSRIAKPHILGMLFVLLGAWYVYKIFNENIPERKYLYISSIFFGLAFGMLNVNVFSILILYSVYLTKNKFDFKKLFSREIFISTILFALVFLCTNWFLIADFHKFLRRKEELSIIFNYGNFSLVESAKFLKVFFQSAIPLGLFPLFCAGIYRAIKEKQVLFYPLIIFLSLHFLFVLLYMKHINTYIISLPFVSIITAYGVEYFVKRKIYLFAGYSLIVILYLFINAGLHTSLFVRQGNLTTAGGWINMNIKQNSTVGVPGGFFSMGNFPAFSYFKYKLMHIPVNEAWDKPKLLPEYLVSVNDLLESTHKPELGKYYLKIYELHESGFFGKLFIRDKNIATENCNVFVYKRITTESQN